MYEVQSQLMPCQTYLTRSVERLGQFDGLMGVVPPVEMAQRVDRLPPSVKVEVVARTAHVR